MRGEEWNGYGNGWASFIATMRFVNQRPKLFLFTFCFFYYSHIYLPGREQQVRSVELSNELRHIPKLLQSAKISLLIRRGKQKPGEIERFNSAAFIFSCLSANGAIFHFAPIHLNHVKALEYMEWYFVLVSMPHI